MPIIFCWRNRFNEETNNQKINKISLTLVLMLKNYNTMDEIRKNFEQYFMGMEIPEDMEKSEESHIVSDLFNYCNEITPSNLFRYRTGSDYHIEAFENDQLWLSKPTTFNDPHDSLLFIDRQNILSQMIGNSGESSEQIKKLLSDEEFHRKEVERFGQDFINCIIKNSSSNGVPNHLSKSHFDIQHKYHEFRIDLLIDLAKKSIKESSLMACFSESITSTLMWAHYSSDHKGFALNYDFKSMYLVDNGIGRPKASLFIKNKLFPVIYTNKRYDASYYVEFHFFVDFYRHLGLKFPYPFYDKLFYFKAMLFKSVDWAYEKEWRIIRLTDNDIEVEKPDFAHLVGIRPKEIFLGSMMSESDRKILIKLARKKKIQIYQMEIDDTDRSFKMKYSKIR